MTLINSGDNHTFDWTANSHINAAVFAVDKHLNSSVKDKAGHF